MFTVDGKYESATIFTDVVEQEAISQVINICNMDYMQNAHVRIMPGGHEAWKIVSKEYAYHTGNGNRYYDSKEREPDKNVWVLQICPISENTLLVELIYKKDLVT